jgi:hypothetical protein
MNRCKIIDFLFTLIPTKRWQGFLISRHVQKCPECQKKLADVEEVRSLVIPERELEGMEDLWPAVKAGLTGSREEGARPLRRRWKWVYASVFLAVVLAGLIWLYFVFIPGKGPSEEPFAGQFKIEYIEIENEPAQAYVFRPRDSNTFFIWVEKKS